MKQLFRCEYCSKVGTEEEIREHEETCVYNYNKKSCWTCKHKNNLCFKFACKLNKEIPEGKYIEQCDKYEDNEKNHTTEESLTSMFNNIFKI